MLATAALFMRPELQQFLHEYLEDSEIMSAEAKANRNPASDSFARANDVSTALTKQIITGVEWKRNMTPG